MGLLSVFLGLGTVGLPAGFALEVGGGVGLGVDVLGDVGVALAVAAGSYREGDTNITQNIYSKAHTAADLQREARWEADRAKAQKH